MPVACGRADMAEISVPKLREIFELGRSEGNATLRGPRMRRDETAVWLYLIMHARRYLEWGTGGTTRLLHGGPICPVVSHRRCR